LEMHNSPFSLCNFRQKGLAKNSKEANRFLSDARDISKGYIEFPKIDCSFDIQHAYDFVISVLDKEYLRISEDRIFKNRNIHLTEESESVLNDLDVILNKGYV